MSDTTNIQCRLEGLRPMIFDRYPGDNSTTLPTHEKMYLTPDHHLTIPAINIFSLLAAENGKSVCRQFFGKNGKNIALGISSFVTIEPFEIPLWDDNGPIVFTKWNGQLSVRKDVARLAKGIPNPKERPVLALPWHLEFTLSYIENKYCTLENLRQAMTMGGILGIGSFRPYFGRYEMTRWQY